MKRIKKFILDWVWQLPQNLVGLIYKKITYKHIISIIQNDINVKEEAEYLLTNFGKSSITLGKYIFIKQRYTNLDWVMKHEYGHYLQSKMLGPLYLLVIGLPSICNNVALTILRQYGISWDYYSFYTEKWANKLVNLK